MWKMVAAFVVFAGLALWLLSKGGDIDISGEKHGIEVSHPAESASAPASAVAAEPASAPMAASAASQ